MGVITWLDRFPTETLEDFAAEVMGGRMDRTPPQGMLDTTGIPVRIVVNHGRLLALCPWGDGGAEYVNPADLRFFCTECRNAANGNVPIQISIPADLDAAWDLLKDRDVVNQNWDPATESLAFLEAENVVYAQGSTGPQVVTLTDEERAALGTDPPQDTAPSPTDETVA
jgi:hypothetical protein